MCKMRCLEVVFPGPHREPPLYNYQVGGSRETVSRELDRQIQNIVSNLEDLSVSLKSLVGLFPVGSSERVAVEEVFQGLHRSIDLVDLSIEGLAESPAGLQLQEGLLDGPQTRPAPWIFQVDQGGWLSANGKSLLCLQLVEFKCASVTCLARGTSMWRCTISTPDGKTELVVGRGATRDRSLRHAILKVRSALLNPFTSTQDPFQADHSLLGEYFKPA